MEHIKLYAVPLTSVTKTRPSPDHYVICKERDYTCWTVEGLLTEEDGYQWDQEFDLVGWWAKDGECPLTALRNLYSTFKQVKDKIFGEHKYAAADSLELQKEIYKIFNPSALEIPSDFDLAVARIEEIRYKVRKYTELFEAVDSDKTLVNLLFSDNFEGYV